MARALLSFLSALPAVMALNNGLALTPQMGWNTWNRFGCGIDEDLILNSARALIDNGLDALGYNCEFCISRTCVLAFTSIPSIDVLVDDCMSIYPPYMVQYVPHVSF